MTDSPYSFYYARLKDPQTPWPEHGIPCGRFRCKWSSGGETRLIPVAAFPEDGAIVVLMGTKAKNWRAKPEFLDELHEEPSRIGEAVSTKDYDVAFETGEWPDFAPARKGHNKPPSEFEQMSDQIDSVGKLIETTIEDGITTQEGADAVANLRDRLKTLETAADEARKKEREPLSSALTAIQAKYAPVLDRCKALNEKCRYVLTVWLKKATQEKAKEIAQAVAEGQEAHIVAEMRPKAGGGTGKRASLRTVTTAKITDYDALIEAIKGYDEVRALAQKIANRVVKAKGTLPGVEKQEERKAT